MAVLVIIIATILIDQASGWVRRRIIEGSGGSSDVDDPGSELMSDPVVSCHGQVRHGQGLMAERFILRDRVAREAEEAVRLAPAAVPLGRFAWPCTSRGARRHAHGLRARPRPHHAQQGLPAAEAQDAGLREPRGRSLRDAPDAHHPGHPDRTGAGRGAVAQRVAGRGHRPGPRRRPLPVRPHRRGGALAVLPHHRWLAPRGAVGAHLRGARGHQPQLGGPRRHPRALLEDRPAAGDPGGPLRALRRPHRLPHARRARRHARGRAHRRPVPRGHDRALRRARLSLDRGHDRRGHRGLAGERRGAHGRRRAGRHERAARLHVRARLRGARHSACRRPPPSTSSAG